MLVISPWPKASKNVVSNLDHLFVILYYLIMVFVGYFNILFCFCFFFFKFHLRTQLQSTNVTRQQYRIFELKWSSKDRGWLL